MIAVGRCTQVITIGVRDHHVVRCVAAIEPLPTLPAMISVVVDEPALNHAAVLDLLVTATVVVPAEIGSGSRRGGKASDGNRSAGKGENNLFHFHLHSSKRRLGVEVEMAPACRTTISCERQNCRKLSRASGFE